MPNIWFVTGSSRGLGRHIVLAALAAGDTVAATARNIDDLDDIVGRYGSRVMPLSLDVSDPEAVQAAIAKCMSSFGRIDYVVNNAGYANVASVEDIVMEDFREQVETNFFGTVYVSKAVVPIMRRQGSGHIFQVASIGSRITSVGLAPYQASKFAVRAFSLVLAQEVQPLGIQVTTLEPGGMRTEWAGSSMRIPAISPHYLQTVAPFARMLQDYSGNEPTDPKKVAQLIVDLAGRDGAPVELLIGQDAHEYALVAADEVAASDRKWKDLTTSVAY
ncbi:SDR family NAD(P)-dependent oxidoreductase [Rhizobium sp. HT1-10]|uniref:SDR family NAD(P)-dependent oxidoreductase n=1 Tax=Rhizobium sp. HT1-10 TaxID=3111638 RepID=UPI003C26FAFF